MIVNREEHYSFEYHVAYTYHDCDVLDSLLIRSRLVQSGNAGDGSTINPERMLRPGPRSDISGTW